MAMAMQPTIPKRMNSIIFSRSIIVQMDIFCKISYFLAFCKAISLFFCIFAAWQLTANDTR
jgi:hypothetical protein